MPKWIREQALPTKYECPFMQLVPSQMQSHTSFLIDSIHSKQKNWTPSIPFQFRFRLTYISGHDSWMWLDSQIRTRAQIQWWHSPYNLRRPESTYGPLWTLDSNPNWWSICNHSWTAFDPTASREKLEEKSASMLATDYHAKNLDDMIPTHLTCTQQWALWHVLKKNSIPFSGKAGKVTLQTSQFISNVPIPMPNCIKSHVLSFPN
jgi:hypothetical protein